MKKIVFHDVHYHLHSLPVNKNGRLYLSTNSFRFQLGLNMCALASTANHLSHQTNVTTLSHETENTNSNNHHNNNNNSHHYRDFSIDKESSLGELRVLNNERKSLPW